MKKFILTIVFLLTAMTLSAQEVDTLTVQNQDSLKTKNLDSLKAHRPLNSISLSFYLTIGWQCSLNYERIVFNKSQYIITSGIGLGYMNYYYLFQDEPEEYFTIPHYITNNVGGKTVLFEYGYAGLVALNMSPSYIPMVILGLRILPLHSPRVNFWVFAQIPVIPVGMLFLGINAGISF